MSKPACTARYVPWGERSGLKAKTSTRCLPSLRILFCPIRAGQHLCRCARGGDQSHLVCQMRRALRQSQTATKMVVLTEQDDSRPTMPCHAMPCHATPRHAVQVPPYSLCQRSWRKSFAIRQANVSSWTMASRDSASKRASACIVKGPLK